MKLHIFYRHYNVSGTEERRPDNFDYQYCLGNLIGIISKIPGVQLHLIYDKYIPAG